MAKDQTSSLATSEKAKNIKVEKINGKLVASSEGQSKIDALIDGAKNFTELQEALKKAFRLMGA